MSLTFIDDEIGLTFCAPPVQICIYPSTESIITHSKVPCINCKSKHEYYNFDTQKENTQCR